MLVSDHQFRAFVDSFLIFASTWYLLPGINFLFLVRFLLWVFLFRLLYSFLRD